MAAIKKEELEKLEAKYGLSEDGLSYPHRCSRVTALEKGEAWTPPEQKQRQAGVTKRKPTQAAKEHPLYGKRILITPGMTPDAKRALHFEEPVGDEIEVREAEAGTMLYGQPEEVDRMIGDYDIIRKHVNRPVMAKTWVPKIGTEISWLLGHELVPVVKGNDNQRGYIWSFPTSTMQIGDTIIQVYGLKTLIQHACPELESKFSGKPLMMYIDGVTLAASIPQTHALLKEYRTKELANAKAGLV